MKIAIIGNSAAAISAIETFRRYDQKSKITVISREKHLPYSRVLLPYFLQGKIGREELFYRSSSFYERVKADALLGRSVESVDIARKRLHLDRGMKVSFDKLLIASGSSPVKPPIPGISYEDIEHLWTIEDAEKLDRCFRKKKRLLIIGGGAISLMLAWVAVQRNMEVTVVEQMPRVLPQLLGKRAARLLETEMRKAGIQIRTGTLIKRIQKSPRGHFTIFSQNQRAFCVDAIIVAAGVRPNIEFLDKNCIETDSGILVNDRMQTTLPDIYAAGDVAQGPTAGSYGRSVHALWTTAVEHGRIAGANMAGKEVSYQGSLNFSVSEFFGLTVASLGELSESSQAISREYIDSRKKKYLKVLFRKDVPVGAVMLGTSKAVSAFGVLRTYVLRKVAIPDAFFLGNLTNKPMWPIFPTTFNKAIPET